MSVANEADYRELAAELSERLIRSGRTLVLTGAGISTDSGIPDYRNEAGDWKHKQPMRFQLFSRSAPARQRYWARSLVGYQRIDQAQPNAAHRALAALEALGLSHQLITQNVDGLHQRAGSHRVIDLHGRLDVVECLACRSQFSRSAFQQHLASLNPSFASRPAVSAPDGDAEPGAVNYDRFLVPPCERCGGVLKPGVVFFGESVPPERVRQCLEALEIASSLLVVGSSLMVFSGFRFARAAARRGIPVYIVNRGKTRADDLAQLKIPAGVSEVLPALLERVRQRAL